jgi:hypothetical protein
MVNVKTLFLIACVSSLLGLCAVTTRASEAYSGNSNVIMTDGAQCNGSEMSVTENVTSTIVEQDGFGNTGNYSWQLEIWTVQNKPAYQQSVFVDDYNVAGFFLENLITTGTGYYGQEAYPTTQVNFASPSTYISAFETFNSTGYPTEFEWDVVYNNGANSFIAQISPAYAAQPQAYQSVLVGLDSNDPSATFNQGSGYFTYYGQNLDGYYNCNPSWGTEENSNMFYASTFNCPGANTCSQSYASPYYLTMNAGQGGSVSPASGYQQAGSQVQISASASCPAGRSGYIFSGWSGSGASGKYTGSNNPATVTMNGAITESASFIFYRTCP